MLKPNEFMNRDEDIKKVLQIINSQIKDQSAMFKEDIKKEPRTTWYLDTKQFALYRNNNFLFRIRKEPDEYDITLKCRHHDRYIAASYDLSSPVEKLKEIKFEEDITSPFQSKFSLSAKFDAKQEPELKTFQELESIFPALRNLGIHLVKA